jgi:predicted transcriptional regulator
MSKLTIKTGTEQEFFARGRRLAKAADRGETLPDENIVSFEDPADLMRLLTSKRLELFRAVKDMPGSITQISERLKRDRSAVKRDLDELASAGLVSITDMVLPGHGMMKQISACAQRFTLQADVA